MICRIWEIASRESRSSFPKALTASHPDPQVLEECLHTLISFNAKDLEPIIITALNNPDDKLRWRAYAGIPQGPEDRDGWHIF